MAFVMRFLPIPVELQQLHGRWKASGGMGSDIEWEKWGRLEPYYGVITAEKYFRANLTQATKQEFFDSGKVHIEHIL